MIIHINKYDDYDSNKSIKHSSCANLFARDFVYMIL